MEDSREELLEKMPHILPEGIAPTPYNIGVALYSENRFDEAKASFSQAVQAGPRSEVVLAHLGLASVCIGRARVLQRISSVRRAAEIKQLAEEAAKHKEDAIAARAEITLDIASRVSKMLQEVSTHLGLLEIQSEMGSHVANRRNRGAGCYDV